MLVGTIAGIDFSLVDTVECDNGCGIRTKLKLYYIRLDSMI